MKTLVAYYSHGGNNKYLATKIAQDCQGDLLEINPRLNGFFFILISSLLKISFGIRKSNIDIRMYDKVVLCGPVFMGQLVSPLLDFLNKNRNGIKKLYFITCCGGGESTKDTKFGYNSVLNKVKFLMADAYAFGAALSIDLLVSDDLKDNSEQIMKIKLNDSTFHGKIVDEYNLLLPVIKKE